MKKLIHNISIERSIISAVKGNLIYQKFKFIISANYSVAINDRNIDKSFVLYWKLSGIELAPGSKILNPFEQIVTVIDNNDYSYKEIDIEEDLEIVSDRISTSKRIKNIKRNIKWIVEKTIDTN